MNYFSNCPICNRQLNNVPQWSSLTGVDSVTLCDECKEQVKPLNVSINGIYCLFEYNEFMKQYFYRYKFLKDIYLAHVFARKINHFFINYKKQRDDWIIAPIPVHQQHLKERTFSQVEELLHAASVEYQQVFQKVSLKRQSQKTREERLQTTSLFEVIADVSDKKMIIFDDIKTTGTTLKLAKEALLKHGANEVQLIALAGHEK